MSIGKIRILDGELVNKIAAGEVIERPASVVKELIENSIDAGADSIVVEVKEGGHALLKVADNGSGMSEDDLLLCFRQHATSKISSAEDLFRVKTLGFRGEALSSITAVSRMSISTRTRDGTGRKLEISAGKQSGVKKAGIPQGTIVEVKELFFNTPARRKHLKSPKVELSHIIDVVTRYSLSSEKLSLRLISDSKELLNVPASKDMLNKIVCLYGKEIARQMIMADYSDGLVTVTGYLGKPYITRKDKSYQSIFVNGRHVRSEMISSAIFDAYHTLLFLDRNPVCVLYLSINPEKTDVNVHPAKEIIRIEKEEEIYKGVFSAIRKAFSENSLIPEVGINESFTKRKPSKHYRIIEGRQSLLNSTEAEVKVKAAGAGQAKVGEQPQARIGPSRVIGQFNRLYILAENAQGLLILDQHAAQERVYFERYMKQLSGKCVTLQKLLKPMIVELSAGDSDAVSSSLDVLTRMGFIIEEYGKNSFRLRKVPQVFGSFTKDMFMDIVAELGKGSQSAGKDRIEERIARMACRKSVKAGDLLTPPQAESLISELDRCEKPYSCPHGRPTVIMIPVAELEGKFKRVA